MNAAAQGERDDAISHAEGRPLPEASFAPLQSVEQLREAVAKSGKAVALLIQRRGNKFFVPLHIG